MKLPSNACHHQMNEIILSSFFFCKIYKKYRFIIFFGYEVDYYYKYKITNCSKNDKKNSL